MMRDAIGRYLLAEFGTDPEFTDTASGSLKTVVETGSCVYAAQFDRDFLEEHDPPTILSLLQQWNVAGEMRRMEGLELSVSGAGVRLDSSN